jgi:Fe-S-cluster-containing dehydrogenase component
LNQTESIRELAEEMKAGQVDTLFILGGNPVYTASYDVEFGQRLKQVKLSVHLGVEQNETASLCTWHIPQAHYLESWRDARAFDGTVTILQPLIAPLYNGKTAHELLGAMVQLQPVRSDYDLVRQFWFEQKLWRDFEKGWRKALHDGVIGETQAKAKQVSVKLERIAAASNQLSVISNQSEGGVQSLPVTHRADLIELNVRPDPSIWDGRFANNGWLQECPKPISKLTWDNAALFSPALARRKNLSSGDVVELSFGGRTVRAPVWIMPGQAENSVTVHLGYGRSRVGRVGSGVGFDAYRLRPSGALWGGPGLELVKVNARHEFAATQNHHLIDSADRQVYRAGTLQDYLAEPDFVKQSIEAPESEETLYYPDEYPGSDYQWGMSIDLTTCIGCNACLVACEVENNIPVVGKDQIARHREMFWIRVDTYYQGSPDNPTFNHMPVPCMHCEHAPCELVCPVAATVHDHEGLNLQVYNRCVGTRFCSNNCPYKVRRFNFYQYTDYHQPSYKAMYNPEVTVRWRGVMEKCTYCVQRISHARIAAEKENRPIRDGEVQTACQQACPADAIIFGNLREPNSRIAALKRHPLDYPMLGQLNTRPRTTHLAKITNPHGNAPRV